MDMTKPALGLKLAAGELKKAELLLALGGLRFSLAPRYREPFPGEAIGKAQGVQIGDCRFGPEERFLLRIVRSRDVMSVQFPQLVHDQRQFVSFLIRLSVS